MKKNILFFMILIASIMLLFFLIYSYKAVSPIKVEISLLENAFSNNDEIKSLGKVQDEHIAIISISDNKTSAIVKTKKDSSIKKAYKTVKKQINKYIKEHNYDAKLIKIDFAKDFQEISLEDLENQLSKLRQEYVFRRGIILSYENGEEIILTEGEINSNNIIDYDNSEIDLEKLNNYLKKCNKNIVKLLPQKLNTFSIISYFCDEENNIYEIDPNTGSRKQELTTQSIENILNNATSYLSNMIGDEGKYIYGYFPLKSKEKINRDYNILRHAGATWSLIVKYDSTENQKQRIDRSLKYLLDTIQYFDSETAYIEEIKSEELKLGGNALTSIALCEYIEKFNNSSYLEILEKLGNGILSMQNKDGSYNHVLDSYDFSLKDEYRTVYYDGEATFALCKLYGVTKNEKYLQAAKKSIQYFIDNNYTKYCDHWISYSINEITKYVDNESYYEFGLKNIANNLEDIKNKQYTSHINFEMLLQGFELYDRILEKKINVKYLKEFPEKEFFEILEARANFQINSYLYPEIAMYLEIPEKYSDTFYIRHSNYRIRIDDIQHSILGYYYYYKNFGKIEEYQNKFYDLIF